MEGTEGTKLLPKLLHFKVLHLRPDGSNVKCGLRGEGDNNECERRLMALPLTSERLEAQKTYL